MCQRDLLFKMLVSFNKGSLPRKIQELLSVSQQDLQECCFSQEQRTSDHGARTIDQSYDDLADRSEPPVLLGAIISTETSITVKILVKFYHQTAKTWSWGHV